MHRFNAAKAYAAIGLAALWTMPGYGVETTSLPGRLNAVITAQSGGSMAVDEKQFYQVPLNTRESNPCSPKDPGPKWRGILIQAPKRVVFKRGQEAGEAFAVIPICGFYTLDLVSLMNGAPMTLIATDKSTQRVYSGAVVEADPSPNDPPPDDEPVDPTALKGLATSSYFNPNLASYVGLPARPAVYEVIVEYGGMQSNKVTIEMVEEH